MKRIFLLVAVIALTGLPASAQKDGNNRIENSGKVMVEILNVPDDIPASILDKHCAVLVLGRRAALTLAGSLAIRIGLTPAPAMTSGWRLKSR